MVTLKDDTTYLEMGIFDAIFSTVKGRERRKQILKKQKEKAKKAKEEAAAGAAAAAASAVPAEQKKEEPKAEEKKDEAPAAAPAAKPEPAAAAPAVAGPVKTDTPAAAPAAATQAPEAPAAAADDALAGLAGLEIVGEVVAKSTPAAPAPAADIAPAGLPGEGDWNGAKIDKMCALVGEGKAWGDIGETLGEDGNDCITKFISLDKGKKKCQKMNTGEFDDKDIEEVVNMKDKENKDFNFIAAALYRPQGMVSKKYNDYKKANSGKGGDSDKKQDSKGNGNANGKDKGKEAVRSDGKPAEEKKPDEAKPEDKKPESTPAAAFKGGFPLMSGGYIDEDTMSSYDPDGPPASQPLCFIDRFDDSHPLKDQYGRELDDREMDYLVKLTCYYDDQKWMDVGSRFFDETGRRVPWGLLKQKLGNLKFP